MENKTQKKIILSIVATCILILFFSVLFFYHHKLSESTLPLIFSEKITLEETGKMSKSLSPNWWLNSGGVMTIATGSARTNFGPLEKNSYWQKLYAKNNSRDTDDGYYPQNIFRLVTLRKWQNLEQQLYFNIDKINLSDSSYRNESNGVLLFNRYYDGDNLYYTGLRVDGHAVIKKKIDGKYYTLAEKDIFSGGNTYDRDKNPTFLPLQKWIGIRSTLNNVGNDTVDIKFYVDLEQTGDWKLVLEKSDKSKDYGKAPLLDSSHAGIRTDFMDVEFQNYKIQ